MLAQKSNASGAEDVLRLLGGCSDMLTTEAVVAQQGADSNVVSMDEDTADDSWASGIFASDMRHARSCRRPIALSSEEEDEADDLD